MVVGRGVTVRPKSGSVILPSSSSSSELRIFPFLCYKYSHPHLCHLEPGNGALGKNPRGHRSLCTTSGSECVFSRRLANPSVQAAGAPLPNFVVLEGKRVLVLKYFLLGRRSWRVVPGICVVLAMSRPASSEDDLEQQGSPAPAPISRHSFDIQCTCGACEAVRA